MSNWKPIETAPQDGSFILGYNVKDDRYSVVKWKRFSGWTSPGICGLLFDFWMPLPESPEIESYLKRRRK